MPVRIKDLPQADPSQITSTTELAIDDATYGARSIPLSALLTSTIGSEAIADASSDRVITVDNTATALVALDASTARVANSLGRSVRGDGAGGRFYFILGASAGHVNNGTVWRDGANTGNWYWDLSQALDGGIPVTLFGADPTGVVLADSAIEAAMEWCYAPSYGSMAGSTDRQYYCLVPPGKYLIDSIHNDKGISIIGTGEAGRYPAGIGTWTPYKTAVLFVQRSGATEDALTLYGRGCTVKNISFVGKHESNTLPKKAITAVASRNVFTVGVADLPGANWNSANYPHYGLCFFYSPTNHYLGTGLVQSFNAGTGQVTLLDGSDLYSTPTGSGQLLTTSCKVIFSPVKQYNFNGTPTGNARPDASAVGPAGICMSHEPMVGAGRHRLEGINVTHFHCGVRGINHAHAQIQGLLTNGCVMSGLASAVFGQSADYEVSEVFAQGFYEPEDLVVETVDNPGYRNCYTAVFAPPGFSYFGTITSDNCVLPIDGVWGVKRTHIDYLVSDCGYGGAIRFGDLDGDTEFVINNLQIRAPSGALPLIPAYTDEAITVMGTGGGTLSIGNLHIADNNGNANSRYPYAISIRNPNAKVVINHVGSITATGTIGAPAWRRVAETNFPKLQSWDSGLSVEQFGSGLISMGGPMAVASKGKASLIVWDNDQVVIGNRDNTTGAGGCKVTMRANQISVGGDASDFFGHTRTNGSDKYVELIVPERTPGTYPANEYGIVGASAEATKNRVFVGGHPGSGRAAATEVQIYVAPSLSTSQLAGSPVVHVQGSNRRVGINTTAPTADLSVNGTADKPGGGSWGTFSDRRLKDIIGPYARGLSEVLNVNPVWYCYNGEGGILDKDFHVGVVAQEFAESFPSAVKANGPQLKDGSAALIVNQDEMIWALVNAVKTLNSKIKELEEKINKLSQ